MKNMQGTTRVLWQMQDVSASTPPQLTWFGNSGNTSPSWYTNVPSGSKLQVNEALLVEKIQFHQNRQNTSYQFNGDTRYNVIINFFIGNKCVLKDVYINQFGSPFMDGPSLMYEPELALYLEGAGILIPPQVEFRLEATYINTNTGLPFTIPGDFNYTHQSCSLYGTGVLLNLNTSL